MKHLRGTETMIRVLIAKLVLALGVTYGPVALAADAQTPRKYPNCKAMNKVYPHGVGRVGARDKVKPANPRVTNFKRSNRVYELSKARDRDNDKIACEKA